MRKESGKDLTSGSPFGLILGFALPMLLGLLFQQFYNMVDTMVVGQCLGVTSLAAVGSTGSINFMINGFCIGAATGFAIPVAQKFGAGDHKGMRKFVANAGYLAAVFLVILFALLLLHIFHALSRQKNQLGQMIGLGCGFVFALQLFHGVMLNLGIGFMTVGIPFLSNGQSVTISAYLLMGMLLSIYRYKDVAVDKKASYQKKYRIRIEKI